MRSNVLPLLMCAVFSAPAGHSFNPNPVDPASQGLDASLLNSLTSRLASGELGQVDGVIILRNGQTVYREFFRGYQGQPLPVFSVTKSVGSVLMGTLVRDGLLDVSESLNDYFPQYPSLRLDALRRQITVEHVLQQRHGHDWNEWPYTGAPDHPIAVMLSSPDWFRTVLTWPMGGPPGETFAYSTGASGLMSGIILHATGMRTQEYARAELFGRLGFGETRWAITHLNQRTVLMDEEDFPQGIAPLGFSLWLRLEDMARLGQLMLNHGIWEGQEIVSRHWVEASINRYSTELGDPDVFSSPGSGYGYQWWVQPIVDDLGRTFEMYYANGYGRQFVLVLPQAEMVVVQLAADYTRSGPGIGTALREHILPALTSDPRDFEPMTASLNGSWYDPDVPGQGLNIEILEDRGEALVYWYTFDALGNPLWLIGQGAIDAAGVAQLQFLVASGGTPATLPAPELTVWGGGELSFDSCTSGRFRFAAADESLSAEVPLARLTGAELCQSAIGKELLPQR